MTTKEEAKQLYEGKFFYEIVKVKKGKNAGTIQLFGPFDNIFFTVPLPEEHARYAGPYKYVQVIDGKPVQAFSEEEILVTDRKL